MKKVTHFVSEAPKKGDAVSEERIHELDIYNAQEFARPIIAERNSRQREQNAQSQEG